MQNQNQERAYEILQQAMSRARGALTEARRAIGNLREVQTTPDDLVESIRTEVKRFSNATGIPCEIHGGVSADVPEHIAEHAHRIVSEALTNITRHAQAQQVWLEVSSYTEFLKIIISDNGMGFDPQALSVSRGHYGLLGMRERARLAGGTVTVESKPGAGTSVRLTLPLKVHSGVV
jgi:NarL family two-component system sensor histidine kinase YdfH